MIQEDINEHVPYYPSKENQLFQQTIRHSSSDDLIEELRQKAFLIHPIFMINLENSF